MIPTSGIRSPLETKWIEPKSFNLVQAPIWVNYLDEAFLASFLSLLGLQYSQKPSMNCFKWIDIHVF